MNTQTNQSAEAISELLHIASDAALLALAGLDPYAANQVGMTQAVATLTQLAEATGWIAQHVTLAAASVYATNLRNFCVRLEDALVGLDAESDLEVPF